MGSLGLFEGVFCTFHFQRSGRTQDESQPSLNNHHSEHTCSCMRAPVA